MAAGRRRRPRRVGRWFGGGGCGVGGSRDGLYRSVGRWYGLVWSGAGCVGLAVVGLLAVWLCV